MPSPEYQREWRKNNPEKYREHYIRAWKNRGPYYEEKIRTKKELKQELPLSVICSRTTHDCNLSM